MSKKMAGVALAVQMMSLSAVTLGTSPALGWWGQNMQQGASIVQTIQNLTNQMMQIFTANPWVFLFASIAQVA